MTIDTHAFRDALGRFATGVTVVTGRTEAGSPVGVTVNSLASLSLEPPMVLFCLDEGSACLDALARGRYFAVNLLGEDQRRLSEIFASRLAGKFDGVSFSAWEGGSPILPGCLANMECTRQDVHPGGDHVIITGRVERLASDGDRGPLLFYRGAYAGLGGLL